MYKDGKYYKPKNLGSGSTDPTTEGNNGINWKRVKPDGTDYLQTGQTNATPYDSNTRYDDPAPPSGQHYYVTHNGKMWKADGTGGGFQGITPGGSSIPIRWTEISGAPVTVTDSSGNTLGTINTTLGERVLTIPGSPNVIYDNAFKNKNLDTVTIPSSVTAIGNGAFQDNADLASVTIPGSVTTIGNDAFKNTDLPSVTIPASVTSIGNGAFMDTDLTTVTFNAPSSVTSIGDDAFRNTELTSVTIPTSVTSIGNNAFAGITTLTQVRISQTLLDSAPVNAFPSSVTTFQDHATPPNTITRTP